MSRPRWLGPVLGVLAAAWLLGTPVLFYGALIMSASFFGDAPDPEQSAQASRLAVAAAVCAVGAPLAGLVLSLVHRRRGAAWGFGIALLSTAAAFAALAR